VIAPAPSFSLTTLAGASVIDKDFAGNPYIAHFVSADCDAACDAVLAGMKKLQDGFEKGVYGALPVHLVTFVVGDESVAEHYREWMKSEAVDPKKWTFVAGPEAILREMAVALAAMGDRSADPVWELGLVLVDSKGRCRGFYGTDRWEIDRAFHQAKDLSREPL
jgi:cytochrome oxidase Cu insertion factor (SCO1/SenC/PrrC family)